MPEIPSKADRERVLKLLTEHHRLARSTAEKLLKLYEPQLRALPPEALSIMILKDLKEAGHSIKEIKRLKRERLERAKKEAEEAEVKFKKPGLISEVKKKKRRGRI